MRAVRRREKRDPRGRWEKMWVRISGGRDGRIVLVGATVTDMMGEGGEIGDIEGEGVITHMEWYGSSHLFAREGRSNASANCFNSRRSTSKLSSTTSSP